MKLPALLGTSHSLDPSPNRDEWVAASAVALAISVCYCSPLYATWSNWGISDWDVHLAFQAVPQFTVTEYGEFPFWNPFACGGTDMLANPQTRLLSPFFPLHLLFGFLTGIKLELVAHLAIGLLGAYALAREVLGSRVGAAMSAIVFMLNGTYTHTLTLGMVPFMGLAYVPWAVLGFVRSATRLMYLWLTGASLAISFFEGGAYLVSITLFGLAVIATMDALRSRNPAPVSRLLACVVLMLGLGAIKFFPSIALMSLFPRKIDDYSGYSLSSLATSLFSRSFAATLMGDGDHGPGFWRGMSYRAGENCMYIGVLAGVLFAIGLWSRYERRSAWLALVVTTLWMAFGHRAQPSLWHLVHQLPIYDSMRVAQRFRIILLLGVGIFCGLGAMALTHLASKRFDPRRARLVGWALVVTVAGDVITANFALMARAFVEPAPLAVRRPEPFRQYVGSGWPMLQGALRNVGIVECYEALNVPKNAIPVESPLYSGETFLHGAAGTVETTKWSPNRLKLDVMADGPGWVIVNQQGYPGWKVEQGNPVASLIVTDGAYERRPDGLLAIQVSRGRSLLDVYYRPDSFALGATTTALFVFAFIMSWSASRTSPRRLVWVRTLARRIFADA